MNEVLLNDNLMCRELASGKNGTCYLTSDNKVFKNVNNIDSKRVEILSKIASDFFVFPECLVYYKDKIVGYIMEYVDGSTFKNTDFDFNIEEYLSLIKKLEYDIAKLSNLGITVIDSGINNVMITKDNSIKIIDTDFYSINNRYKNIHYNNMGALTYALMYPFFDVVDYRFKSNRLNKYVNLLLKSRYNISSMIELLNIELKNSDLYSTNIKEYSKNLRRL